MRPSVPATVAVACAVALALGGARPGRAADHGETRAGAAQDDKPEPGGAAGNADCGHLPSASDLKTLLDSLPDSLQ